MSSFSSINNAVNSTKLLNILESSNGGYVGRKNEQLEVKSGVFGFLSRIAGHIFGTNQFEHKQAKTDFLAELRTTFKPSEEKMQAIAQRIGAGHGTPLSISEAKKIIINLANTTKAPKLDLEPFKQRMEIEKPISNAGGKYLDFEHFGAGAGVYQNSNGRDSVLNLEDLNVELKKMNLPELDIHGNDMPVLKGNVPNLNDLIEEFGKRELGEAPQKTPETEKPPAQQTFDPTIKLSEIGLGEKEETGSSEKKSGLSEKDKKILDKFDLGNKRKTEEKQPTIEEPLKHSEGKSDTNATTSSRKSGPSEEELNKFFDEDDDFMQEEYRKIDQKASNSSKPTEGLPKQSGSQIGTRLEELLNEVATEQEPPSLDEALKYFEGKSDTHVTTISRMSGPSEEELNKFFDEDDDFMQEEYSKIDQKASSNSKNTGETVQVSNNQTAMKLEDLMRELAVEKNDDKKIN